MLRKQKQLRLILDQISNPHKYNHNNLGMMSCVIRSDPFCEGFNARPRPRSSSGKIFSVESTSGGSNINAFRIKSSKVNGLVLRCCFDSNKPTAADQKAGTFFAPQRVRYLDFEEGCTDARLFNGRGSNQRGSPLGFIDNTLPEKIVVAVDVDEVLGNFVSALNRFIADQYSLNCSVSEYHVYEFFKIWNCSRDEADIRVHEFFKTPYFKTGIHPLPGAQKALHKLSRFCNLSVVTSRQNAIKAHTIEWIEKHFPGLFEEIHFGNHFALDGESRPKSEICRSLGAEVLIDDNPRYAIECAEVGIRVLLFDYEHSYPWCKTGSIDQHPLVTKVHNWEEVEQQINSWIVS